MIKDDHTTRLLLATLGLLLVASVGCSPETRPGNGSGERPPTQVVAVPARLEVVSESLSLVGTLAANEQVEIKSETDGTISRINFEEGQIVEEDRLLVALDETKSAASLSEAEANFALSRANYERARQLLDDKLISQQEFDQTAASFAANEAAVQLRRRQLQDARIHAPFGGVVGTRMVSPGQVISRNTTLTWVVDLDPLKVEVNVPERFLSQVLPEQKIALNVAAWPGESFSGRVFFVSPFVNPETRTMLVKAEVPNPDLRLKPGMFAGLELTLQVRTNAIVIPESAISQVLEGGRATVMIVGTGNIAELRPIKVGLRLEGSLEVTEGLSEGEQVIVEGLQKIGPGMPVAPAPAGAMKPYLPQEQDAANRS